MLLRLCAVVFESEAVAQLADAIVVSALLGEGAGADEVAIVIARRPALEGKVERPFDVVVAKGLLNIGIGGGLAGIAVGGEAYLYNNCTVGYLHVVAHVVEIEVFEVDEGARPRDRWACNGFELVEVLIDVGNCGYLGLDAGAECEEDVGERGVHIFGIGNLVPIAIGMELGLLLWREMS